MMSKNIIFLGLLFVFIYTLINIILSVFVEEFVITKFLLSYYFIIFLLLQRIFLFFLFWEVDTMYLNFNCLQDINLDIVVLVFNMHCFLNLLLDYMKNIDFYTELVIWYWKLIVKYFYMYSSYLNYFLTTSKNYIYMNTLLPPLSYNNDCESFYKKINPLLNTHNLPKGEHNAKIEYKSTLC